MKKTGLIFVVLLVVMIGVFFWSLSGASDKHAPAEQRTIDVSPNL